MVKTLRIYIGKGFLILSLLIINHLSCLGQTYGQDLSLQLSASVQSGEISLNWINDGTASGYIIYRRLNPTSSWGTQITSLSSTTTSYVDNTITDGYIHEYKVVKEGVDKAYGYIYAGYERLEIVNRGIMIIVVENTYQGNSLFDTAIQQTIEDIENDGWIVERLNVNQNDAVTAVKNDISSLYNQNPTETRAVYLIGHVPVPYSGLLNPDAHPDHLGAWPADIYYADMDGVWTDVSINDNTSASQSRNHNVPGDGKFDQSIIPSALELELGRVDFANMSSFSDSEETLLIRYLNKAHLYKTKQFSAMDRALIDDNFTAYDEGFSSSGYRNFSPMFTAANVNNTNDLRSTTATDSYMWSYGCGAGSYTSCSGIGNTSDFAGDSLQTIFMMLFGSYFGDWDSDNNVLRASIAQGQTLNAMWAGRPHWSVHHMALGEHIGYSTRLTQNNQSNSGYFGSTLPYFDNWIHISLMGDPTMRMHYVLPPTNLVVVNNNDVADLSWTASPEATIGYNVYRLAPSLGYYEKVNTSIVTGTTFSDNTVSAGEDITYVVKAVELRTTASGSYFNESLGIRDNELFTVGQQDLSTAKPKIAPNPVNNLLFISGGEALNYIVYDVRGKIVLKGEKENSIDFSQLEPGSYYLSLMDNFGGMTRFKLIHN